MAMLKKPSGTGNAPIVKQGHTTSGKYGNKVNAKGNKGTPRDLNLK